MSTRVVLDPRDPLVACGRCGYTTVHVARVIADSGEVIGKSLVCTSCRRHRQFEAEERAEAMVRATDTGEVELSAGGGSGPGAR